MNINVRNKLLVKNLDSYTRRIIRKNTIEKINARLADQIFGVLLNQLYDDLCE